MGFKIVLSVVSAGFFMLAFIPYIRAVWRDRHKLEGDGSKPKKSSWIIATGLVTITMFGMYAKGALNWSICGVVFGCFLTLGLALKYGKKGWTRLDKFCLFAAIIGIGLWFASGDAVFGIVVAMLVDFIAWVPTFVSSWHDSSAENKPAWVMFWFGAIFGVMAIPAWTLADTMQPLTFLLIESIMVFILFRSYFKFKSAS